MEMTRKEVRETFNRVFCGDIGIMESYLQKVGYNRGLYGWNFNVFLLGNVAIVSGYRNLIGDPLPPAAIRILKNAQNMRGKFSDRAEYMRRAKKKLEKVLNTL